MSRPPTYATWRKSRPPRAIREKPARRYRPPIRSVQILLQKSPAAAALNVGAALCWPLARLEAAAVTHLNQRTARNLNATDATRRSRNTHSDCWRCSCHQLGKPAQVLGDSRQRELELGSARPAQSQAAKPQDALQVSE